MGQLRRKYGTSSLPGGFICLYVASEVTRQRIEKEPAGRPLLSAFELGMYVVLQASLAMQYAFTVGKPCYLLDSSSECEDLAENTCKLAEITYDAKSPDCC
jgi:hypothetical protein